MARKWLEAINTPNHLLEWHPSILNITFIARAKATTSKTTKAFNPLQAPKPTLLLTDL
jgi:hypothetical protein